MTAHVFVTRVSRSGARVHHDEDKYAGGPGATGRSQETVSGGREEAGRDQSNGGWKNVAVRYLAAE